MDFPHTASETRITPIIPNSRKDTDLPDVSDMTVAATGATFIANANRDHILTRSMVRLHLAREARRSAIAI